MTDSPLLSVIVPTHDVSPWISEALGSILDQGVAEMEVLVVDDHSTDDTVALVTAVASRDARVRLIEAQSVGGGSARNTGVAAARGQYLVFADGDDIVPHGAYSALTESLRVTGSQVAVGDYLKFSPTRTWSPTAHMTAFAEPGAGRRLADMPTLIFSRPCWNKAFDRKFWLDERITFPDVPRSNDIVPMTTAYVRAAAIDMIDDVVYLYRERPGASSMTAQASSAEAFVSYLTQELLCAQLVLDLDDEALTARYRALVYDRDGFFHAAKYLGARTSDVAGEDDAVALTADLLALVGAPPRWIDVRKRATMALLARGEVAAAAAAAGTWHEGPRPAETALEFDSWAALLAVATEPDMDWVLQGRTVVDGAVRALRTLEVRTDADAASWRRLAARLADAVPAAAGRVPELAAHDAAHGTAHAAAHDAPHGAAPDTAPDDALAVRRDAAATVTAITGGAQLMLAGSVAADAPDLRPLLHVAGHGTVAPRRVRWSAAADGGRRWHAEFALRSLPRDLPAVAVVADPVGHLVTARVHTAAPEYQPWDGVLYEQFDADVTFVRRAHWSVRAPRRAAIILRDRLRALLRPDR